MGYSPPLSLWRLVEQHVQTHERDEIKSMLGVGVVDETLELHEELHAFLEIWRDCRCNSQKVSYGQGKHISIILLPLIIMCSCGQTKLLLDLLMRSVSLLIKLDCYMI